MRPTAGEYITKAEECEAQAEQLMGQEGGGWNALTHRMTRATALASLAASYRLAAQWERG